MRTWIAVSSGLVLGFLAALTGTLLWRAVGRPSAGDVADLRSADGMLDLFRLSAGGRHEVFLVRAGPDGIGEPALADALFPGEEPPRELASLLLANVSPDAPWDVQLTGGDGLRCRGDGDPEWRPLEEIRLPRAGLDAAQSLRLRGLGAGDASGTVEPRALRKVLLALPRGTRFEALSDVQWGTTSLLRDKLDVERVRRFREDPAGTMMGR